MSEVDDIVAYMQKKSQKFPLDQSKIQRHPVEPTGLELTLYEAEGDCEVAITLNVDGFSCGLGNIKRWCAFADGNIDTAFKRFEKYKKEAIAVYEKVAEAIKKGDYVIHLYGNGNVKVEVKY